VPEGEPIIGRDSELNTLAAALTGARPRLILLVGGPRSGKGRLLRELRVRAAAYPCRIVPDGAAGDLATPWLVVDRQLTVDDFRSAVAPPEPDPGAQEPPRRDFDLILVHGYRPDAAFHEWFVGEFLPDGPKASPPRVVVVAGSSDDVEGLAPLAEHRVELFQLEPDLVADELRAIGARIRDPLEEEEVGLYARAIAENPALFAVLHDLLPLTRAAGREETMPDEAPSLALTPHTHWGGCPCGGVYETRIVEIRMTVGDEVVLLEDVQQGACPICGSRVYKTGILERIECLMRDRQAPAPRARV
jgi:hypothetical protein